MRFIQVRSLEAARAAKAEAKAARREARRAARAFLGRYKAEMTEARAAALAAERAGLPNSRGDSTRDNLVGRRWPSPKRRPEVAVPDGLTKVSHAACHWHSVYRGD